MATPKEKIGKNNPCLNERNLDDVHLCRLTIKDGFHGKKRLGCLDSDETSADETDHGWSTIVSTSKDTVLRSYRNAAGK